MTEALAAAPVLSTPDSHILSEIEPFHGSDRASALSEEQLIIRYEIDRTVKEIRRRKWRRVALQFPDHMLPHSSRVYEALSRHLSQNSAEEGDSAQQTIEAHTDALDLEADVRPIKLTILADTSYGSCCVDEIAAEHIDAEAVVHYGRACLSPTARLPVLHIFTQAVLDQKASVDAFVEAFPDHATPVILTGDIPYASHLATIGQILRETGYNHVFPAEIVHDPSSLVPNRTVPPGVENVSQLGEWHLFHIAEPPTSLLLTLSSRVKSIRIYSPTVAKQVLEDRMTAQEANTAIILRRRYALVTSMATTSTWGILINTLSVKNYLSVVEQVKRQIAAAGKKSYLFVVGKLNAAKVANFAEIEGWVVIGCWESSLIDSRDFFKPILTPFELDMALAGDDSRIWTGAWRSDFDEILNNSRVEAGEKMPADDAAEDIAKDFDSEEESAPPEFDLRTGRYVARTRPMGSMHTKTESRALDGAVSSSRALTKRTVGDLVAVNGVASPAAEYLSEKRTWKGLGSDFEIKYEDEAEREGSRMEEGRTGTARGYSLGDSLRT